MNIEEYQQAVKRTCATEEDKETLKMGLVGMLDELGEVMLPLIYILGLQVTLKEIAGPLKKHLWHGHELESKEHLEEELGDTFWYLTSICNGLDINLGRVLQKNVDKLQKRYPDGFSSERSINRGGS